MWMGPLRKATRMLHPLISNDIISLKNKQLIFRNIVKGVLTYVCVSWNMNTPGYKMWIWKWVKQFCVCWFWYLTISMQVLDSTDGWWRVAERGKQVVRSLGSCGGRGEERKWWSRWPIIRTVEYLGVMMTPGWGKRVGWPCSKWVDPAGRVKRPEGEISDPQLEETKEILVPLRMGLLCGLWNV